MRAANVIALLFALTLTVSAAHADVTAEELDAVAAAPPPNAALPLHLGFRDENGRPVTLAHALGGRPSIVIFADYTCHTLCGPILEFAAAGLAKTGLKPGADYRLMVIGLDPKDGLGSARAMRADHIDRNDPIGQAAMFLTGGEGAIRTATQAVGLRYAYDAQHDQFAHPTAVYVVDSDGRVRRVLSALGLDGTDLRLALIDSGQGAIGSLADRIHLLCYGYDPVRGIYTQRITIALEIGSGATLLVLGGGILAMTAHVRRRPTP